MHFQFMNSPIDFTEYLMKKNKTHLSFFNNEKKRLMKNSHRYKQLLDFSYNSFVK
jgi:hypothetical protein